ncbi:MAG: hypothetical protein A2W11_10825, partial [Ignavibacteria bacterium RBG_16_35_7]
SFTSLGYSLSGEIIKVGEGVSNFKIGDLVACGGGGYANHAEINYIPKNLCAKIPSGVDLKEASLTPIASIAMQGFRQTNSQLGETIAVIGLGLLGQILVQLIRANGCRAFGFDIEPGKCEFAKKQGAEFVAVANKTDFEEEILSITNGYGCDSVIITTGTQNNNPIIIAGKIARDKANIVDIGITKMNLPWELYYHKELDFRFSRSYGPGRYDASYEEGGNDYPIGYVRWTEQRNMESILQILKACKIDFAKLITHSCKFEKAVTMYNAIKEGKENFLGVVLLYDSDIDSNLKKIEIIDRCTSVKKVCIGGIGAGNYASTMLYPFLKKNSNIEFVSLATATGINAKDKAEKNNFRYATTDYKTILADDEINTVVIATRHNQHAKMVAEALKENKNVYVEKPLAINEEEIRNIIEAYKSSNRLLMVGYNRRYSSSIKYLKKYLNPNVPYSIYYQVNAGFVDKNNWYQSLEQGGRIIGECGHFVDTLQYLLDANPISVFTNSSATGDMPEQDNSFITIRFDNGSTCVIAYLSDGDNKYPKEKIFITGFRTNIEFDNFKKIRVFQNGKTKIKKYSSLDKGQKDEMNSLVNAVIEGKQPVSFESTILTTLTTIYAIKSLKNQKRIPISLDSYL